LPSGVDAERVVEGAVGVMKIDVFYGMKLQNTVLL
jgi:hypothetical protein